MTDNKQPVKNDQLSTSALAPKNVSKPQPTAAAKSTNAKPASTKASKTADKAVEKVASPKKSTLALFAFLFTVINLAVIVAGYFWYTDNQKALIAQLTNTEKQQQDHSTQLSNEQGKLRALINQQTQSFNLQLEQLATSLNTETQQEIAQLTDAISRLKRTTPNDWLIHETEYLLRVAARSLWLERDTKTAIGLLKEADLRLSELNEPDFFPIRQVIYQDIETLLLMPNLATDEVILALMGLSKKIPSLPLVMIESKTSKPQQTIELSDDMNDWQENLIKTWQIFYHTFIKVHRKEGDIKPILSTQYRQNIKENLSLKLQQAQWAASKEQPEIYQQSLNDIQLWLQTYFAMDSEQNQLFYTRIETLKEKLISYSYPSSLASLSEIRSIIMKKKYLPKRFERSKSTENEPATLPQLPIAPALDKITPDLVPALTPKLTPQIAPETTPESSEPASENKSAPETPTIDSEPKKEESTPIKDINPNRISLRTMEVI